MTRFDLPFVGSEAVTSGALKKHELRARFRAVFPDVYVPADAALTLRQRGVAAWLWSHREGVLAGLTASALHGAKWIDESAPIELVWPNARPARGLRTYNMRLRAGEFGLLAGLPVTSLERTAFDIGRRGRLDDAVARLDALGNAAGVKANRVRAIARRHRGARGIRQLDRALDLFDAGSASPKETWLRLLLIRAGFPRPQTQISVISADGCQQYYLDLGWEGIKLAVEYDGDQHRVDRLQFAYDIERFEHLVELGWTMVRITSQHRPTDILRRAGRAWDGCVR